MTTELQIIHARDFLRVGAHGRYDLDSSRGLLMELVHQCTVRGVSRALLDIRDANSELTPPEIGDLVRSLEDYGFDPKSRLAVLHKGDYAGRAELFALLGLAHRYAVKSFGSFEEAVAWLAIAPEADRELLPDGESGVTST